MAITAGVIELIAFGHISEAGAPIKRVSNVYHYGQAIPNPVLPDPATVITSLYSVILQNIAPLLHDDYVLDEVTGRWLDQTTNPQSLSTLAAPGVKTGDRLPAYATVCFQLHTNVRGRSYRGSKHYGPIAEADTTADQLAAGVLPAWTNMKNNLLQSFTIGGQVLVPVVLSRTKSQLQKDPVTISAAAVTSVILNLTLGTLKKRKEKTVIA